MVDRWVRACDKVYRGGNGKKCDRIWVRYPGKTCEVTAPSSWLQLLSRTGVKQGVIENQVPGFPIARVGDCVLRLG